MISPSDDQTRRFADEQTDRRLHEHMSKENDVITEADIANIRTDIDGGESVVVEETTIEKTITDDSDPEIDNDSWNVLES